MPIPSQPVSLETVQDRNVLIPVKPLHHFIVLGDALKLEIPQVAKWQKTGR